MIPELRNYHPLSLRSIVHITILADLDHNVSSLTSLDIDQELCLALVDKLDELQSCYEISATNRITKKPNTLYNGSTYLPMKTNTYLNFSDHALTDAQKQILSLGIKCQFKPKFSLKTKQMKLEILYCSLMKLMPNS